MCIIPNFDDQIEHLKRDSIASELRSKIKKSIVVGIDGVGGSGKSNLADYLAGELIINSVHLDAFLDFNKGYYVKALRFDFLAPYIALQKAKGSFIIEGCCLLDVAKRLNLKIDYLIYCKAIDSFTGQWKYESYIDEYSSVTVDSFSKEFEKEIFEYTKKGRYNHAHMVYMLKI